jgi:hypothetical protein
MHVMQIDLFRRSEPIKRRGNSLGVPHDGDCALWLGSLSRFVQPSRTARYSGLAGQSPLPEKDPHDLEGTRWRLRLLVGASQRLRADA